MNQIINYNSQFNYLNAYLYNHQKLDYFEKNENLLNNSNSFKKNI